MSGAKLASSPALWTLPSSAAVLSVALPRISWRAKACASPSSRRAGSPASNPEGMGLVGSKAVHPSNFPDDAQPVAVARNARGTGRHWLQAGWIALSRRRRRAAQELEEWLGVAREHGLDTRLRCARPSAVLRTDERRWRGALHTASDARAEPSRAAPAIARAAQRRGAQIFSHCAVRGIDRAAGRIQGVITERGRVAASLVVCAGGAWTGSFCRSMGIAFPQLNVLGTVARYSVRPAKFSPGRPGVRPLRFAVARMAAIRWLTAGHSCIH